MPERFRRAFLAYPEQPADIAGTITSASDILTKATDRVALTIWPQLESFGAVIPDKVRQAISDTDVLVCDVTLPNLNVYYEAGFAIGSGKAIAPIVNASFSDAIQNVQKDGFFDNVGFKTYDNSNSLADILLHLPNTTLIDLYAKPVDTNQPLYFLDTYHKTDFRNAIMAAIDSAKVYCRTFEPVDMARFSTVSIVGEATASSGIIIPILAPHIDGADRHNLRAAFLCGMSHGLGRPTLAIQMATGAVAAIDYRDNIHWVSDNGQIPELVASFALEALLASQSIRKPHSPSRKNALQQLSLGASAAESEFRVLQEYFVETSEFLRALRGEVTVVAGRKGSGKSAIFYRVSDTLSSKKRALVAALKPDSHQLSLFREELLKIVDVGVFDHTLAAFWYFVILSELAITIAQRYEQVGQSDADYLAKAHSLRANLARLEIRESGDFTARINRLGGFILAEISQVKNSRKPLSADSVTNVVFRDGISVLKKVVIENTIPDDQLYLLFDNIDKGWPANGVDKFDVRLVRLLLEALEKVTRDLDGAKRQFHSIIFLRNDIYELLVDETPDRGKTGQARIDWADRAKLRQVIYRRLEASTAVVGSTFQVLWTKHFVSLVNGRDSFEILR